MQRNKVVFGTKFGFIYNCHPYQLFFLNIELVNFSQTVWPKNFECLQTSGTYQNYISSTTHLTSNKSHRQMKCICYFLEKWLQFRYPWLPTVKAALPGRLWLFWNTQCLRASFFDRFYANFRKALKIKHEYYCQNLITKGLTTSFLGES